jgi:hypothetical protein
MPATRTGGSPLNTRLYFAWEKKGFADARDADTFVATGLPDDLVATQQGPAPG